MYVQLSCGSAREKRTQKLLILGDKIRILFEIRLGSGPMVAECCFGLIGLDPEPAAF